MAVALGTAGTEVRSAGATTITTGNFTVAGADTALLAVLILGYTGTAPTGLSCAWNTSGTMAQIIGPNTLTGGLEIGATYFFWIANPAHVTATATVSWTNAADAYFGIISFSGTDTATPFINATTLTNQVSGTSSLTITTVANGAAVGACCATNNGLNTWGPTNWFIDPNLSDNGGGAYDIGTAPSVTMTGTLASGSDNWSVAGVAVQPPTGGGGGTTAPFNPSAWSSIARRVIVIGAG